MSDLLSPEMIEQWLPPELFQRQVLLLMGRVGMTKRRAECFVRLWAYVFLKDNFQQQKIIKPPLQQLEYPLGWVVCSCREAAELFYQDRETGSDRSAGMMLDKLAALGLIKKQFDGNTTEIKILPLLETLAPSESTSSGAVIVDAFDLRSDAVPIANLLASNYNWLNRNAEVLPYRIANILRDWASQYSAGMRVLRRCDNQNPIGFYVLYPTQRSSESKFFVPPSQGLHLSQVTEVDPFEMAKPGDPDCRSVFVRSWMIDDAYRQQQEPLFLQDAQATLRHMQLDFPNLWDMYTLVIHPSYTELARILGFQKTSGDPKLPLSWMYQSVDRFLSLDIQKIIHGKP
jgi:hypothetical protein